VCRCAVQEFSSGGSGFDPSFSKTEKVRVVGIDYRSDRIVQQNEQDGEKSRC